MEFSENQFNEPDHESLYERGFEAMLKLRYKNTEPEALAQELQINISDLKEVYKSREDFYLKGFRQTLLRSCEDLMKKKEKAATERKLYEVFRISLLKLQTKSLIYSLESFYESADKEQKIEVWEIIEEYAVNILTLFNRALSVQNRKQFIYCLSVIFSKNTLEMHESPYDLLQGCGNTECNILMREIKAMRENSKNRNGEE